MLPVIKRPILVPAIATHLRVICFARWAHGLPLVLGVCEGSSFEMAKDVFKCFNFTLGGQSP